jgi:phage terminase small subunit
MVKLTPKQTLFVAEYLIDLNATQAAIRAGYSKKTAYSIGNENLSKPVIAAAIQLAFTNRVERTEIDQDWVLNRAVEINDRCMQKVPVMEWDPDEKKMIETGEWKFEPAGANKSLELVGKHVNIQAFNEKIEINDKRVIIKDMAGGKLLKQE